MAIEIADAEITPDVNYNRIFIVRIVIHQDIKHFETVDSNYDVQVRYRTYGVDADDKIHFSGKGIRTVNIDDFLKVAKNRAMSAADMLYLETFLKLQDCTATIVAEHMGTTSTVVL